MNKIILKKMACGAVASLICAASMPNFSANVSTVLNASAVDTSSYFYSDFEQGSGDWSARGMGTSVSVDTDNYYFGKKSLFVSGRTDNWNGVQTELDTSIFIPGNTYSFSCAVLELPYIFGTQPGRKPVWTVLIEQIAFMDKWPFTMYPKGGTAMLTCRQVGEVICGAAERKKAGFEALPIGMYNLTWTEFLSIVYDARGMGKDRKIIGVAPWMMKMGMIKPALDYKKRKIDSGMDVFNLPDIMDLNLFINNAYAKELGATEDDIVDAIFDSIRVSEASYNGTVKLLEMKGE